MNSFWHKKKVLVTGHTGFKGSWLSSTLHLMGAKVNGFALEAPTTPNMFELVNVKSMMDTHQIGNINNFEELNSFLCKTEPEIVFHLAAQPLVRYSYKNPLETFQTNVMGTANILEGIKNCPSVRAVVIVTTDKCYENKEWHYGYRETDAMGGYDPYSSSKGCAELVVASYRNSFFNAQSYNQHKVSVASARAGNVIGGGDWAMDRLVPDILQALSQNKKIIIRNPGAIRPWQHVLEPLSGYMKLAEKAYTCGVDFAEAFNFGPNDKDCKSVEVLTRKILNQWDSKSEIEVLNNNEPHEAHYLKLDSSKAHAKLNWWPVWNFERTIEKTVQWYQSYLKHENMLDVTQKQIMDYFESQSKI